MSTTGTNWRRVAVVTVALLAALVAALRIGTRSGMMQWASSKPPVRQGVVAAAVAQPAVAGAVACIGSVEPEEGVRTVPAPAVAGRMPVVARLLVREGDEVRSGQALAELSTMGELRAAARQAGARVEVAARRLAQVKAGARTTDVRALELQVEGLEKERAAAVAELGKKEALVARDLIPRMQLEPYGERIRQLEQKLREARQQLSGLGETRSADVELVEAELRAMEADKARTELEMALGVVRAPQAGRVIRLMAREGEAVGPAGLLELAPAGRMAVYAEVYETDATRVRAGQKARISAEFLTAPVAGVVTWISPQIEMRSIPTLDPAAAAEARVYKARIVATDGAALANRIHAKVDVLIEP